MKRITKIITFLFIFCSLNVTANVIADAGSTSWIVNTGLGFIPKDLTGNENVDGTINTAKKGVQKVATVVGKVADYTATAVFLAQMMPVFLVILTLLVIACIIGCIWCCCCRSSESSNEVEMQERMGLNPQKIG